MVEDKGLQGEQITAVVEGFTQVWNKFEATLSKELAQIEYPLVKTRSSMENHTNANYGLVYRVSSIIYHHNNLTMGELSSALSVPMSTATRIIDFLVENKYVQRYHDEEDRRIVRVALTDIGREIHQATEKHIGHRVQQVLACLTDKERDTLLSLLGKVVSKLKDMAR